MKIVPASVIGPVMAVALASAFLFPSTGGAQGGGVDQNYAAPGFNAGPESIGLDPKTGKAVVVGAFTSLFDPATGAARVVPGVARLDASGALDTSFTAAALASPNANSFVVSAVAVQADSKVVVGGNFILDDAVPHQCIARFLSSGQPDVAFNVNLGTGVDSTAGEVSAIAIQPDGKILVGGSFLSFNGASAPGLVRLNANLTRDLSFVPDPTVVIDAGNVNTIVVQPDGNILLSNQGNTPYRLTPSGTLDASFDASGVSAASGGGTFDTLTGGLALESNGNVLAVLNYVTSAPGEPNTFAASVVQLTASGALDTAFDYSPKIAASDTSETPVVHAITPQFDGTVIFGGQFATVGGARRTAIARVRPNGLLDGSFSVTTITGAFPAVETLVNQDANSLLVGASNPQVFELEINGSGAPKVTVAAKMPVVHTSKGEHGVFTFKIPAALAEKKVISYELRGSAVNGTNYALLTGKVNIVAGATSARVMVKPKGTYQPGEIRIVKLKIKPESTYKVGTTGFIEIKIEH